MVFHPSGMASPLQSVPKDRYSLPRMCSSEHPLPLLPPSGFSEIVLRTPMVCSKFKNKKWENYGAMPWKMPLLTSPKVLQTEFATTHKKWRKKKKVENCIRGRTLLWLLYHLKQQTLSHILKPSMCHTVNICSWPAFQQRISSKGLPGRAATRGTLLVSEQSWNLNTWKLRQ